MKTHQEMIKDKERSHLKFDELLKPYAQGGTKENPVKRTMGTILDYFLNKKKYPPDVVGAAVLMVFIDLHNGKKFLGDETYGSPGRELVTHIRLVCDAMLQRQEKEKFLKWVAEGRLKEISEFISRESLDAMPWFIKIFSSKYWRARAIAKAIIKAEKERKANESSQWN